MPELPPDEAARWRLTERLREALVKQESPRLQMAVLVALSGAAGFLASVALLRAGLARIPVRYVTAVAIAYVVFLTLLYLWILRRRWRSRARSNGGSTSNDVDPVAVLDLGDGSSGGSGSSSGFSGGGGRFGGGGASGAWSGGAGANVVKASGSGGDGLDLDGDDAIVVIAIAVAALALLGASVWIVFTAPSLFAELLVDGGLSAGLYRRLGRIPHQPWLETALKKTILPFLLAALTLGAAGLVMERHAPEARSLGGVLAHVSGNK